MAHLHTEPGQHDHTVGAYIVRLDGDEPRIVLHRHKKLGCYLQFGGHIELDENPWQALRHEVREESGYELDQLTLFQPRERVRSLSSGTLHPVPVCYNTHRLGGNHFHSDVCWAFVTDEAPRHDVGEDESSDIRSFSRSELLEPTADEVHASVREVSLFVLDVCLYRWERVSSDTWG
ncbi:MAG: putative pyrophosphohydrolase including oxidative damage repair enzyme [Acidimicrobiaceae bacterium]|jgi:8-oxo-dGTP diphosphatase|nr:putative pyrophosphohydrolase including oxidative damage repair enzyme [Acidimicrobiaceae bacterium]